MYLCTPIPLFLMCFQVIADTDEAITEKLDLRC